MEASSILPAFAVGTASPLMVRRSSGCSCRSPKFLRGDSTLNGNASSSSSYRPCCSPSFYRAAPPPLHLGRRITITMDSTAGRAASAASLSLGQPPVAAAFVSANSMSANRTPPTHRGKQKARTGKKEHHLWMKRDTAGSGQKALNLVRIVSKLPNEKEAIYGALDKWSAFETEFPLVAIAKALGILREKNQWLRIIQVTKWLLNKGQGMTMGTYDVLLLAFDMDGRVDEADILWNTILQTHTRSVSKRLFSRMISLYSHHHMPEKILEVFADMEELGVKPDEDTVRRVGSAFQNLGQEDNQKRLLQKYGMKFRYLHFNGERVRVRNSKESED